MKSPQAKIGVITAVLVLGTVALLLIATVKNQQVSCEACVTFRGLTQCRTAVGPTEEEATRTAVDNACAFLASGMTDSISCGKTRPDSVTCSAE